MYNIAKNYIAQGGWQLDDLLARLRKLYLLGSLTEPQLDELTDLARAKVTPADGVDVINTLLQLDQRVKALETAIKSGGALTPQPKYPEYVVGTPARDGQVYSWRGQLYICTLPEYADVCVWSPDGYPAYWRDYTGV